MHFFNIDFRYQRISPAFTTDVIMHTHPDIVGIDSARAYYANHNSITERMRTCYHYCIVLIATIMCCAYNVSAQNDYGDSLKKTILQSVEQQLEKNTYTKAFLDSLPIPSYHNKDLKILFENINQQISKAKSEGDIGGLGKAYQNLSTIDSIKGNYKSAYENFKLYTLYRDSVQKQELEKKELQAKMQSEFDKKQAQQQLEKEKEDRKNAIRLIFLIASLLALVAIATSTFIAYKREQKAKKLLGTQKSEIENTLSELRSTQQQLVQSEKMASLGELTAGIAHEIQNPLNFVNNFSDVNTELLEELKEEADKGNLDEVKAIANDALANEQKINHHGKRADSIVKSMLQHSRKNEGKKELTDINALCDEYLRLSFHGLRAKDKSFNADFKTDLDETIGKINVVPQDISRVLLNLFNNAFYAVMPPNPLKEEQWKPVVSVKTKKINDTVEIIVSDNGNGIPQNIIDKIFQPFFTTKPTGQGTGLGLSLAYDIITKEHNGTIKVESKEGEGTKFIINLPVA